MDTSRHLMSWPKKPSQLQDYILLKGTGSGPPSGEHVAMHDPH